GRGHLAMAVGPEAHEKLLVRDAQKERFEARTTLEVIECLNARYERALHELLHVFRRSTPEKPAEHRLAHLHELVACGPITRAPAFEQRVLRRICFHHGSCAPWRTAPPDGWLFSYCRIIRSLFLRPRRALSVRACHSASISALFGRHRRR